ncbi:hypothetical protein [Bacillus phage vB_BanS-Thrax5]|nr:hypothetical protein [Bacillus phage vB_BanS-Thrax5]
MKLEEYLKFFEENDVSIQITLDVGKQPTVRALQPKRDFERNYLKMTEADTLLEALEQMKVKLFG